MQTKEAVGDSDEMLWDYEIPIAVTQIVRGKVFFKAKRPITVFERYVIQQNVLRDHDMMMCSTWADPVEGGEMISIDVELPRLVEEQASEKEGEK